MITKGNNLFRIIEFELDQHYNIFRNSETEVLEEFHPGWFYKYRKV